ncbi:MULTISPECIES: RICIN domain-containing protein [unclassified Streptomyces]|uniref:RICIN domain-containing protein n=1 Tax=unclassified Streptomyces TaxID=2593676 RepID=UPI0013A6D95D|nr:MULTISPECIES: RICIN domain-containing protein [unclassified Streptomyces]QZZ25134.1 ricin-type beta-trefoil lectin domain protein [Streptomyces sp. ST1015]
MPQTSQGSQAGEGDGGDTPVARPPQQPPRWAWWLVGIVIPLVGILVTVLTVPSPPSAAPPPSGTPSSSAPAPGSATPSTSPPPLPAGLFRLTNVDSRMCLSPPPGNPVAAAGLIQSDCDGRPEQFWRLHREGTDETAAAVHSLRNEHTGLCLSVDGAHKENDVTVTHYLCGDDKGLFPDQFWSFRYDTARHGWKLVSRNSGKCVALPAGSGDGEQALQEDCDGDTWLLWRT